MNKDDLLVLVGSLEDQLPGWNEWTEEEVLKSERYRLKLALPEGPINLIIFKEDDNYMLQFSVSVFNRKVVWCFKFTFYFYVIKKYSCFYVGLFHY